MATHGTKGRADKPTELSAAPARPGKAHRSSGTAAAAAIGEEGHLPCAL